MEAFINIARHNINNIDKLLTARRIDDFRALCKLLDVSSGKSEVKNKWVFYSPKDNTIRLCYSCFDTIFWNKSTYKDNLELCRGAALSDGIIFKSFDDENICCEFIFNVEEE